MFGFGKFKDLKSQTIWTRFLLNSSGRKNVGQREGGAGKGGREGGRGRPSCGAAIVGNQLTSEIAFAAQEYKILHGV